MSCSTLESIRTFFHCTLLYIVELIKLTRGRFRFSCSICGCILLAAGLYCVLWGKNKEIKEEATKELSDSKEEIIL